MPKVYPQELIGYTVSCSGLCDDGQIATYSERFLCDWLERARDGWSYLAGVFGHIQSEVTFFHSDLDPKKLTWQVQGVYRIRLERESLIVKPLPRGDLTAGELARLP